MDGFLLIDKPAGMTSHDVIDRVRRITGERTVGHAGTLDPFATGLLIVGVGRSATKKLAEHQKGDKEYVAVAVLGATSDTQDGTGKVILLPDPVLPSEERLRRTLADFTGSLAQTPPMYSAKKVGGKKLYELARQGMEIERKPANVTVHDLELLAYSPPHFTFRVACSSGTYVRTLAHDIGAAVGSGAYLERLRRTKSGIHAVEAATPLADLTSENWQDRILVA